MSYFKYYIKDFCYKGYAYTCAESVSFLLVSICLWTESSNFPTE